MGRFKAWWAAVAPAAREAHRRQAAARAEARARCEALVEYVRAHHGMDGRVPEALSGEVLRLEPRLHDPNVAVEEKKYLLLVFAHAESEAALTALEGFFAVAEGSLRHFASYALQEARARRRRPIPAEAQTDRTTRAA